MADLIRIIGKGFKQFLDPLVVPVSWCAKRNIEGYGVEAIVGAQGCVPERQRFPFVSRFHLFLSTDTARFTSRVAINVMETFNRDAKPVVVAPESISLVVQDWAAQNAI